VREVAIDFKERDIDILGISGGDGTNHKTLSIFTDVYGDKPLPKIAFLRGGTMNNLANQLEIHGTPEDILSNLIVKYHEEIPFVERRINMIKVNGDYGFLFGLGLINRFIDIYQNVDGGPTPLRAALLLIRATISSLVNGKLARHIGERFDADITIDGKPAPFKNYMMIFIGTMRSLGFKFRPLYRSDSEEGRFQAVAICSTGRQLMYTFPKALLAKPANSENVVDEMTSEVILEFPEPMPYSIDGDIMEEPTRRVEITTGPLIDCIVA
jgi:diacylglycerol kinase family enzyme